MSDTEVVNLLTESEGLLGTHVRWEDIQAQAVQLWGESAAFGPNKAVKNIGENAGFLSRMALIEPDWIKAPELGRPDKFVVKILSGLAMMEAAKSMLREDMTIIHAMEAQIRKLHRSEIELYKLLTKYKRASFVFPEIYYLHGFTEENTLKGYIMMEYIEGNTSVPIYSNMSVEDIKQPIGAMAAFGAMTLQFTDEEMATFNFNPLVEMFKQVFTPETIKATIKTLRDFGGERLASRVDQLETVIDNVVEIDFYNSIAERLGIKKTLVHGDLWSNNMIWNKNPDGSMKLRAIIDFQTCHLGLSAFDLARLINSSISGKDRQANWELLLEEYYRCFQKEVGKDIELPYTLEQLKESYRQFLPVSAFGIALMIGPIFALSASNPDPEVKEMLTDGCLDKIEALLDDIFTFHERNKKIAHGEVAKAEA